MGNKGRQVIFSSLEGEAALLALTGSLISVLAVESDSLTV